MMKMLKKIPAVMIAVVLCLAVTVTAVRAEDTETELITVEEPVLSESDIGYVEWIESIPIDAADVVVTEMEVEGEIGMILSRKTETETDEEYIRKYSAEFLSKELKSMEELREYVRDDLYHSKLQAAIYKVLEERVYVDSYARDTFMLLKEYAERELQQQVEMYENIGLKGWDTQKVAEDLGYASPGDFLNAEAMHYGNAVILLDYLATSERITYNDEEVEQAIWDMMGYYGYDDKMTLEDYIEFNGGEPWRFMVEKLNVEYHKVLGSMEKYAVIGETENLPETDALPQPEMKMNESPYTSLTTFTGTTMDGTKLTQDLFGDKTLTILNVWATWCGFCIDEMPELAEYAAALPENIQLVTFCTDGTEAKEEARSILEESGMSAQDVITLISGTEDLETLNSQVIYLPTTLFFNSKGEIVGEAMIGGQENLKAALDGYVQDALSFVKE